MMKKCHDCKDIKDKSEFHKHRARKDGLNSYCKLCTIIRVSKYRTDNYDKVMAKDRVRAAEKSEHGRIWRSENPNYGAEYRKKNKDKIKAYQLRVKDRTREQVRVKNKERRKTDPAYRAICRARNRVVTFMRGKPKVSRTLGGSFEFFKKHIESQFKPGMTWDNYGKWELDHYFPLSPAYKLGPEVFEKACNYKNIRPEWADTNKTKNDNIPQEYQDISVFLKSF